MLSAFQLRLGLFLFTIAAAPAAPAGERVGHTHLHEAAHAPKARLREAADIYANIPERDDLGRDQLAMFRAWNPDPIGHHEANLKALSPRLAAVVRKAQADNPGHRFVIGSGRRAEALQKQAMAWGWSRTPYSAHQTGAAVDLWPLDRQGRVTFDRSAQIRIAAAMRRAAAELGVPIRWGGPFRSFKGGDRSHFELVPN